MIGRPFGGGSASGSGVAGEPTYPASHRHGDSFGGEFSHGQVAPSPGRLACERWAAARRSTSFAHSNNRFRRCSSRSSAESLVLLPGLVPSPTSVWRIHFARVIRQTPKSAPILPMVTSPSDVFHHPGAPLRAHATDRNDWWPLIFARAYLEVCCSHRPNLGDDVCRTGPVGSCS